jgi:CubicO group peptidase (beta-lactamase class C family)
MRQKDMTKIKYAVLIVVLIASLSCGIREKNIRQGFENLLKNEFSEDEPGGIILVQKGSKIIFIKSYGVSDINTKEKITSSTIFNTGSISKTFVANAILILQEEKLLSVKDTLIKYFPDFENKEIAKRITIEHLLSHTSGLPDLREIEKEKEFYLTAEDKENFEPLKKAESLLFKPGEKFEYSNPAYNGLALIIESVTNKKWQGFVKERIFKPSGMTHSLITDGGFPDKGVAHAYIKENNKYKEYDYGEFPTFTAAGNGGIWCSVLDLAKYELAIRNHVFLSEKSIEKSRSVFKPDNWKDIKPPKIGYAWFIREKSSKDNKYGVKIAYHTGSQGGFRAFFISIPEKEIVYIALFNRPIKNFSKIMDKGLIILKNHNWFE